MSLKFEGHAAAQSMMPSVFAAKHLLSRRLRDIEADGKSGVRLAATSGFGSFNYSSLRHGASKGTSQGLINL